MICFMNVWFMLNQNKKITIGITAYKDSDYLEMAINSVLNQTYLNYEILVVDDCSTDDTADIIKKNGILMEFIE